MEKFVGSWKLIKKVSEKREVSIIKETDKLYTRDMFVWLTDSGYGLFPYLVDSSGLRLDVKEDGFFEETKTGNPEFDWYTEDGCLDSTVTPYNGQIVCKNSKYYLQTTKVLSGGKPKENEYGLIMRYDDGVGDCRICEQLSIDKGLLVRSIGVVWDEVYFSRTVLVYSKI